MFKNVWITGWSGQLQSAHETLEICLKASLFCGKFYAICKGIARTQSPTIKNYALELPTFGVIVGVSLTGVQWKGLTLEEPPSWSWLTSAPGKYAQCLRPLWPMNPDPEDQLKQEKVMLSGDGSYTFTFYLKKMTWPPYPSQKAPDTDLDSSINSEPVGHLADPV